MSGASANLFSSTRALDAERTVVMDQTKATSKQVTLVGVDYSDHSRVALATAAAIAEASPGAELHVLHVVAVPHGGYGASDMEPWSGMLYPNAGGEFSVYLRSLREEARLLPQFTEEVARRLGDRMTGHIRMGRADREIVRLADDLGAQLIVVGTRQHSEIERMFLGSVAEQVVREAPCAVLVARPRERPETLIEAPCPDCVQMRKATAGDRQWCARHSQHHPRPHTYGAQADSFGVGSMTFRF
jgi:nucleotide-binding universal stress UspA family protein